MKLFNQKKHTIDETNLANDLFTSLGVGGTYTYPKETDEILKKCHSRQEVLDKVLEYCIEADTPQKRYLLAKASSWSNAKYRKQSIYYITKYLNNELYEYQYKNISHFLNCIGYDSFKATAQEKEETEKRIHISNIYQDLGKSCEGEYLFTDAKISYSKAVELTPFYAHCYIKLSQIYEKMNTLNEAMNVLISAKKSIYYPPYTYTDVLGKAYTDTTFKEVIDRYIKELQEKIDKGYVYKARRKIQ